MALHRRIGKLSCGLIEAITRERPIWGNPAEVVRKVRSPLQVAEILQKAGLPCPMVAETLPTDTNKTWLIKPRQSRRGAHIRPWRGETISPGRYCQEWLEGDSCSALFVGRADNSAIFLGATRQLVGVPWLNSDDFHYCGNIGPLNLSAMLQSRLEQIGTVLVEAFGLRGFFGVDFILKEDIPWPVEINPRYTAGIEILERAAGHSLFYHHQEVFTSLRLAFDKSLANVKQIHGKAILFARKPLVFPLEGPWQASLTMAARGLPR